MPGLLGSGWDDPQSSAMLALAGGLLRGDAGGGLLGANNAFAEAKQNAARQQMFGLQAQEHQLRLKQLQQQQQQAEALRGLQSKFFTQGAPSAGGMLEGAVPPELQTGAVPVPAQAPKFDVNGFTSAALSQGLMDPMSALQLQAAAQKDDAPIKLGQGEALFDRKTLKPIANNPKAEDLPSAVREYNFARQQGYPGTFQQFQIEQKRAGATNVSVSTGQKGLDNELKIRSDFRSEPIYKAHGEVQSAYSQITGALKQNSPAGDLAAATKIMKMLDPGSVVRESELGMAMAATGLSDRVQNYANMIATGQKLTPKQRQDFQALADQIYSQSAAQYNAKRNEYSGFAKDYGLNEGRILGQPVTSPRLPTPQGSGAAAAPRFLGFEEK